MTFTKEKIEKIRRRFENVEEPRGHVLRYLDAALDEIERLQKRIEELEELIEFATDRNVFIANRKDFPEHLQYLFKDPNYQPPQEQQ